MTDVGSGRIGRESSGRVQKDIGQEKVTDSPEIRANDIDAGWNQIDLCGEYDRKVEQH